MASRRRHAILAAVTLLSITTPSRCQDVYTQGYPQQLYTRVEPVIGSQSPQLMNPVIVTTSQSLTPEVQQLETQQIIIENMPRAAVLSPQIIQNEQNSIQTVQSQSTIPFRAIQSNRNPGHLILQQSSTQSYNPTNNVAQIPAQISIQNCQQPQVLKPVELDSNFEIPMNFELSFPPVELEVVYPNSVTQSEQQTSYTPPPMCLPSGYPYQMPVGRSRGRSKMNSWLPILFLSLLNRNDGCGCGRGCGSSSCSGGNCVYYPVPVPVASPIIVRCDDDDYYDDDCYYDDDDRYYC